MSILNVDKIQPIGGGSTITVDATDIQASTGTITASTFSGDVSATGIGVTSLSVAGITTFSDNVKISSNKKLTFNNPGFEIYHNNSNAYLDNNVGHLYIRNDVDGDTGSNVYIQAKSGENGLSVGNDGAVVLFYDNNVKLQTTNTGTYTTGIGTFTDKVSVTGSQNSMLTNNQLIFDRAGTSYIDNSNNSGALSFRIGSSYTVGLFIDSSANVSIPSKLMHHGDTDTFLEFSSNTINFDTAGYERLRIDNQGSVIIATGTVTSFGGGNTKLQVRGASSVISDGAQIFDIASTAASNGGTRLAFGVNEDNYTWIRSYESAVGGRDMVFATPNEALRITSTGKLFIGHSSSTSVGVGAAYDMPLQVIGNSYDTAGIVAARYAADANGPTLHFVKSRNATKGSQTIVQVDDTLGFIRWYGSDGTDTTNAAAMIAGYCDATPASNKIPGRLSFWTTDTLTYPRERLRIDSNGKFCLGTVNVNYASNDGIVSIVNAASSGTENPLLTLWNPTTVVDARAGIDFLTNAQYGTGRDGAFIRGSNDGVTAKAHIQFGTIKDETYDTNFEIKSTGAVVISCDTGNTALTLTPTLSASTSMIFNTWADNTNGRNWAIRNRYTQHGRLEFMRGTNNTNDPLTTVMYLEGTTVHIAGTLSKNAGSFKIPHPLVGLSTTKDLVHSFIEGPQMDLIYRGKVTLSSGAATVNLDTVSNMTEGTFVVLNRDVQCFTTNETGWGAVKGSVSGNILTISAQDGSSTDTISWMVIGERQDNTVKSLDLTDDNGDLIVEPLKESVINN